MCSCFADFTELVDNQPTTQEVTQEIIQAKPIEPVTTGYCYEALKDPILKELYSLIHENSQDIMPSIEFNINETISEDNIRITLDAYIYDHPEVFWLDTKFSYFNHEKGSTSIWLFYTMESKEVEKAKEKFNTELEKALSQAPKNASAYELEMFAHDYIVDNCEYDYEAAEAEEVIGNEDNAYGALIDKKAVCSGYSKAFQLLCNKLGLDCVSILGESEGAGHQWNCVKLEDEWYHLDVTWDDSENGEICQYDYFNLDDEAIYSDHTAWELYSEVEDIYDEGYNFFVPECTSDKYNYYKYSCVTISDIYYGDEVVEAIAKSAQNGDSYISFYVDENLDYSYTLDTLIYDGFMYDWIQQANSTNDYEPEIDPECGVYDREDLNIITVELIYL